MLGLALGDALGAPFEFRRAVEVPAPIPALELPWAGGPPGSTTDDTAMARNLVRSLTAKGRLDADDLVARHLAWFEADPPDVGNLTRRVLRRVARGEDAVTAARAVWEERGPEVSAGNGSVMYAAPLGAFRWVDPDALLEEAPALSALTHHDGRCKTATLAVTTATALVIGDVPRGDAVGRALSTVADREGGEELEFLTEEVGRSRPIDGPDQGFCLFAAGAGLKALAGGRSFEEEIPRIVALGGDTDTNAAVAGALLGAAVGVGGLPWLDRLVDREEIEAEARALAKAAPA